MQIDHDSLVLTNVIFNELVNVKKTPVSVEDPPTRVSLIKSGLCKLPDEAGLGFDWTSPDVPAVTSPAGRGQSSEALHCSYTTYTHSTFSLLYFFSVRRNNNHLKIFISIRRCIKLL